jgi:hypothetical protein
LTADLLSTAASIAELGAGSLAGPPVAAVWTAAGAAETSAPTTPTSASTSKAASAKTACSAALRHTFLCEARCSAIGIASGSKGILTLAGEAHIWAGIGFPALLKARAQATGDQEGLIGGVAGRSRASRRALLRI